MTTTIIDKALRRVADDVAALIEEHGDAIRAAISNQMLITAEEDDEAKLVFSLAIGSKITPSGDGTTVTILDEIKTKAPEPPRPTTLFFTTADGGLVRSDPRQRDLPLREVPAAPREVG